MYAKKGVTKSQLPKKVSSKVIPQPDSHDYIMSQKKPLKYSTFYGNLREFVESYNESGSSNLSENEREKLCKICKMGDSAKICSTILSIPRLKKGIIHGLNTTNNTTISGMSGRVHKKSILTHKSPQDLQCLHWTLVSSRRIQNEIIYARNISVCMLLRIVAPSLAGVVLL